LGTSLPTSDIKKALSFLLAHQNNEGYWEATSSFSWNKTEATTAALFAFLKISGSCLFDIHFIMSSVLNSSAEKS